MLSHRPPRALTPAALSRSFTGSGLRPLALLTALSLATAAPAQVAGGKQTNQSRQRPLSVFVDQVQQVVGSPDGQIGGPAPRGACPPNVASHTDANFSGGSFVAQGGFAQGEIAAVSFVLPANAFPIKINLAEMIFATQSASVQTTTEWSFLVWAGTPTNGSLEYEFNSDNEILPHLIIPPGTNGVNVQVMVDPGDPEQIIISDPGNHTFTIGYRVDRHNQQTQNPCIVAPPSCCNAFPTTDTSGLANPTNNWLYALNCGIGTCAGWKRFSELVAGVCRPSGDWVMRATWESVNCGNDAAGACCLPAGGCEIRTRTECAAANGSYLGDNILCGELGCPPPIQACCFPASGGCLNLFPADCMAAGGIPGGEGNMCGTFVCFPTGACCLPDGSCIGPVSPANCQAQGGVFQGNSTSCGTVNCPIPTGACCFNTNFCLTLTQSECATAGGSYQGHGTTCATNPCVATCACDFDASGTLNSQDFFDFLNCFFATGCGDADFNADEVINSQDFFDFLNCFFSPPTGC